MTATVVSWDTLLEGEELAHLSTEPAVEARLVSLPDELHPALRESLTARGITGLFDHQADVLAAARAGRHVLIATGTASGKTLAFNLPVLDALSADPKLRALYLYPAKALAQDQARSLAELAVPKVRAAIYDGDTEPERRWQIRKWANLILTNPDMLSVGVLPHHDRWGDMLGSLRYVVVDEAHVYRGVFGSHVGNVLRRLRRLAGVYGSQPQLLLASATIGNPAELGAALIGEEVAVVDRDSARRAERTIALWNPPLVDPELGLRGSALAEASRLLAGLVERELRTICFTKSRKAAELIHRFTLDRLGREYAERLSPYRAGYTPAQRREIERRLVQGELLGVTATDALELGIDIGLLDCAISVGFPGTVASLRQQWGRAGRRDAGLAVLVASEDALDQFFMREPDALLSRRVEAAILDHANPRVLDGHVRAAAFEAPISEDDGAILGHAALERAQVLAERGELVRTPAGYGWGGRDYPAGRLSLRSTGGGAVAVVDTASGQVLGSVDEERAPSTVHEGAIYLHLGESFRVLSLDLTALAALVEPFDGDYYTQTKRETLTTIEEQRRSEHRLGVELQFGHVSVTEQVIAYQKRSIRTQEAFDLVPLDLPPRTFHTEAIWFCPEPWMLEELHGMPKLLGHATRPDRAAAVTGKRPEAADTQLHGIPKLLGTLHAAEHSLIALLPLWAMCDRWDIGGLSTNVHPQTGRPTIFVYDGHAGGVGITERGFDRFEGWTADTARMLAGCPCEHGCPSCVQSPKCGNLNEPLDKAGALSLLQRMLDART
jgi:DEAD/DEAH box helicase domain-containing protein